MTWLSSIFSLITGVLKELLVPLLAYLQGKKAAKQEAQEEVIKDAEEAQKDKNSVLNLDGAKRKHIVYRND